MGKRITIKIENLIGSIKVNGKKINRAELEEKLYKTASKALSKALEDAINNLEDYGCSRSHMPKFEHAIPPPPQKFPIVEPYLSTPPLQNGVTQAQLNLQSIGIVELNIEPVPSQRTRVPHHGQTKIRTCRVERGEDNTLLCSACGRKIPSTRQGEIDLEKLAHEIAFRQW